MASIVHEGDLDFSRLTLPAGLKLPEHVGGWLGLLTSDDEYSLTHRFLLGAGVYFR